MWGTEWRPHYGATSLFLVAIGMEPREESTTLFIDEPSCGEMICGALKKMSPENGITHKPELPDSWVWTHGILRKQDLDFCILANLS